MKYVWNVETTTLVEPLFIEYSRGKIVVALLLKHSPNKQVLILNIKIEMGGEKEKCLTLNHENGISCSATIKL